MAVYGFNEKDHRRVSRMVRDYENSANGNARKGPTLTVRDPYRRGRTTSVITARSGDTPGDGTAQFNTYNRDTNTLGLTEEYEVKSDFEDEFPIDAEAVFYWFGGVWWIVGAVCP